MSEENNYRLLAVAVCNSIVWNKKYKMYYCSKDWSLKQPFQYIGLYDDKSIRAMGRVENCITADYDINAGELFVHRGQDPITKEEQPVTESQKERLLEIFREEDEGPVEIYSGYKFYLLDENDFTEMDFCKGSGRGLRSCQYLNLQDYFGGTRPENDSSQVIAELLEGKTW
ncbi:hypothetical protein P0082_01890 [Candidatus Haliotispira prima]|uniref:Uncharacterized protein n=1 Tax=Candidatus Haliotispira prima TaxID=3034016 RepID=A0ABY8MHZ9_9SPIO|nr:hypothetical protein P0082_01890 [Candidatus Haliotispira prima]